MKSGQNLAAMHSCVNRVVCAGRRLAKRWSHREAVWHCFPVASSFSKTAP